MREPLGKGVLGSLGARLAVGATRGKVALKATRMRNQTYGKISRAGTDIDASGRRGLSWDQQVAAAAVANTAAGAKLHNGTRAAARIGRARGEAVEGAIKRNKWPLAGIAAATGAAGYSAHHRQKRKQEAKVLKADPLAPIEALLEKMDPEAQGRAVFTLQHHWSEILGHEADLQKLDPAGQAEAMAAWAGEDPLRKAAWGAVAHRFVRPAVEAVTDIGARKVSDGIRSGRLSRRTAAVFGGAAVGAAAGASIHEGQSRKKDKAVAKSLTTDDLVKIAPPEFLADLDAAGRIDRASMLHRATAVANDMLALDHEMGAMPVEKAEVVAQDWMGSGNVALKKWVGAAMSAARLLGRAGPAAMRAWSVASTGTGAAKAGLSMSNRTFRRSSLSRGVVHAKRTSAKWMDRGTAAMNSKGGRRAQAGAGAAGIGLTAYDGYDMQQRHAARAASANWQQGTSLGKREIGPQGLSEAEREQRRAAARARWEKERPAARTERRLPNGSYGKEGAAAGGAIGAAFGGVASRRLRGAGIGAVAGAAVGLGLGGIFRKTRTEVTDRTAQQQSERASYASRKGGDALADQYDFGDWRKENPGQIQRLDREPKARREVVAHYNQWSTNRYRKPAEGLGKREKGKPLSEAELQQRRDAAKKRAESQQRVGRAADVGAVAGAGLGAAASMAAPGAISAALAYRRAPTRQGAADGAFERQRHHSAVHAEISATGAASHGGLKYGELRGRGAYTDMMMGRRPGTSAEFSTSRGMTAGSRPDIGRVPLAERESARISYGKGRLAAAKTGFMEGLRSGPKAPGLILGGTVGAVLGAAGAAHWQQARERSARTKKKD